MCLSFIGYQLDFFKRPLPLRVMSKEKTFTYFGVVLSLIVLGVICLSFFQSDMVQKTSPVVLEKTTIASRAPKQIFGKGRPFAFGVIDVNGQGYIDDTIFKIDVAIFGPDLGPTGYTEFPSVPCETISDSLFLNQRPTYTNSLCILDGNIVIQGQHSSDVFKAIYFQLRICNNVTCKSEDEIVNYLSPLMLYTLYPDYTYDIDNYDNPYSAAFSTIFQPLSINNSIWMQENMKQSTFVNDDFFLYSDPHQNILSLSDTSQTQTFSIMSGQLTTFNTIYVPLTAIYFCSSNNIHYISRTYEKIQTALANCSGIASALFIIGKILTEIHSRMTLLMIVIKNLYVFKTKTTKSKIQLKKSRKTKTNKSKNNDYQETLKTLTSKRDQKEEYELKSPTQNEEIILKNTGLKIVIGSKTDIIKENDIIEDNIIGKNIPKPKIQNFEFPTTFEEKIQKNQFLVQIKPKILSDLEIPQPEMEDIIIPMSKSIPKTKEIKIKAIDSIRMMSNSIQGHESKIKVDNDKIHDFEEYLKKHIEPTDNKNFNINILNLMIAKGKLTFGRKLSHKEKLILKAEEVFYKEIDIVSILIKLQEIEKLKYVLLNPSQISLLKLLDKPVIHCDDDNKNLMMQLSRTIIESGKRRSRAIKENTLVDNYKQLIRSENKSEIDSRILQLLDDEMKLYLEQ